MAKVYFCPLKRFVAGLAIEDAGCEAGCQWQREDNGRPVCAVSDVATSLFHLAERHQGPKKRK